MSAASCYTKEPMGLRSTSQSGRALQTDVILAAFKADVIDVSHVFVAKIS